MTKDFDADDSERLELILRRSMRCKFHFLGNCQSILLLAEQLYRGLCCCASRYDGGGHARAQGVYCFAGEWKLAPSPRCGVPRTGDKIW